ncbi:zinc-ribbon domain-containing protein [Caproicibacterium sp. NSD3]
MFCPNCGAPLTGNERFCANCGTPAGQMPNPSSSGRISPFLVELAHREKVSASIWIVVAGIQILTVILVNGTAMIVLICSLWNLYAGYSRIQQSKKILTSWIDLVNIYERSKNQIIFNILLNAFIGGIVGVIGGAYDMLTRNYVLEHQNEFNSTENFK